jgi:hypothetical protein
MANLKCVMYPLKDFITPHGLQHELVLALSLLSSESSVVKEEMPLACTFNVFLTIGGLQQSGLGDEELATGCYVNSHRADRVP